MELSANFQKSSNGQAAQEVRADNVSVTGRKGHLGYLVSRI